MHGNVEEWCGDWYGGGYYKNSPSTDPKGPETGKYRVVRGGHYMSDPLGLLSPGRRADKPGGRYSDHGFRLAHSPGR